MNAVPVVFIHAVVDVSQDENNTGGRTLAFWHDGVHSVGSLFYIIVLLHIFQQIQPEFVQSQVHDGNAAGHLFNVHNLFL